MDSRQKETFYVRYFVVLVSASVILVGIFLLNYYLSFVQIVTRRVCCPMLVIAGKLFILGLTLAVNCIMCNV